MKKVCIIVEYRSNTLHTATTVLADCDEDKFIRRLYVTIKKKVFALATSGDCIHVDEDGVSLGGMSLEEVTVKLHGLHSGLVGCICNMLDKNYTKFNYSTHLVTKANPDINKITPNDKLVITATLHNLVNKGLSCDFHVNTKCNDGDNVRRVTDIDIHVATDIVIKLSRNNKQMVTIGIIVDNVVQVMIPIVLLESGENKIKNKIIADIYNTTKRYGEDIRKPKKFTKTLISMCDYIGCVVIPYVNVHTGENDFIVMRDYNKGVYDLLQIALTTDASKCSDVMHEMRQNSCGLLRGYTYLHELSNNVPKGE